MEKPGYRSLNGIGPLGSGEQEFFVSNKQIDHLNRYGPESRYFELQSVADVLSSPRVIFKGLRRQGKEDAICYVGTPRRYGDGWTSPGHPGMVFLVCMTVEWILFEWGWEKADPNNSNYPTNVTLRFEKEIWKQSENS